MTILVPTDFSEVANTAVRYSAMLAKKLNAKIILFHAVPHLSVWWAITNEEMVEDAHSRQQQLKQLLNKEGVKAGKIEMQVFYQFPLNKFINDFIRKNKIDIAVIGTKGTTGLKNAMMGSFALGMIEHVSIPVIAVPPGAAALKGISKILYPTDMENTVKELKKILPYAIMFDSAIHVVHISKKEIADKLKTWNKLKDVAQKAGYKKITTDVKTGGSTESLIAESIKDTHADLLVMFPKEKGFFKKLFSSSVTQEMSHRVTVPLFAIKKK